MILLTGDDPTEGGGPDGGGVRVPDGDGGGVDMDRCVDDESSCLYVLML